MTRPLLVAPCGTALGATVLLAACTNMSGLSGSSSFACKAPDGVTCDSVSGTYANAVQNNLPSQRPKPEAASSPAAAASAVPAARGSPPRAPVPALSQTRLLPGPDDGQRLVHAELLAERREVRQHVVVERHADGQFRRDAPGFLLARNEHLAEAGPHRA